MIQSKSIPNVCVISHNNSHLYYVWKNNNTLFDPWNWVHWFHSQEARTHACTSIAHAQTSVCAVSASDDGLTMTTLALVSLAGGVSGTSSLMPSMRPTSSPAIYQGHLGFEVVSQEWDGEGGSGSNTQQMTPIIHITSSSWQREGGQEPVFVGESGWRVSFMELPCCPTWPMGPGRPLSLSLFPSWHLFLLCMTGLGKAPALWGAWGTDSRHRVINQREGYDRARLEML